MLTCAYVPTACPLPCPCAAVHRWREAGQVRATGRRAGATHVSCRRVQAHGALRLELDWADAAVPPALKQQAFGRGQRIGQQARNARLLVQGQKCIGRLGNSWERLVQIVQHRLQYAFAVVCQVWCFSAKNVRESGCGKQCPYLLWAGCLGLCGILVRPVAKS